MTTQTILKQWEYDLEVFGYELSIFFREDNHVAISEISFSKLYFYPLTNPEAIKDCQRFKTDEDVQVSKLSEFFWQYLNEEPFLEDRFVVDDDYSNFYSEYWNRKRHIQNREDEVDVDDAFKAIATYYNLPQADLCVYEDDYILDADVPNHSEYHKFLELVYSVWRVVGENLEYDDGAYNRRSGYADVGRSIFIYSDIDEPLTNIEFFKLLQSNDERLIKAKRTIILWLQQFQPLGIRNLKKLECYLFGN